MATVEQQLNPLDKKDQTLPTPDRVPPRADTFAALEGNGQEATALQDRGNRQAERDAAAFAARMNSGAPAPVEAAPPAPPAPEAKKGLFSRIGGWFKGAFEPSVEARSAAHAKEEAAKNPLVAQQMKAMEADARISKEEFKRMMKEGAAGAKAEAKKNAIEALSAQSAAIGDLGIVGHNEAFGKLGEMRVAVDAKAKVEATKKAAAEAKAALTAGLSGKEAKIALGRATETTKMTADQKAAEGMIKKGDAELMEMIEAGKDPVEAAAFLASQRRDQALSNKAKVAVGKVMKNLDGMDVRVINATADAIEKGAGVVMKTGKRAWNAYVDAEMQAGAAKAERLIQANQPKPMPNKNAGDQVLSDAQILADQALNERRMAQRKAEGSTMFSKKKPSYADTALSGITKAKQYVQYVREQTKRGPTVSEAVSALANADIHGAGMKAVDAGIDAVKTAGRGAAYLREQTKRGPTVSEAAAKVADFAANADIHGAGMKAVDAGIDTVKATGRGAAYLREQTKRGPTVSEAANYLAKDWEATKQRMAERLAKLSQPLISDQLLRDAGVVRKNDFEDPVWTKSLGKGDEDVPDEISQVVAETAAERQEGPANFAEVYDALRKAAESGIRAQVNAFMYEAEQLEKIAQNDEDPAEHHLGDQYRGWKTADVKKLIKRLHDQNVLAK